MRNDVLTPRRKNKSEIVVTYKYNYSALAGYGKLSEIAAIDNNHYKTYDISQKM